MTAGEKFRHFLYRPPAPARGSWTSAVKDSAQLQQPSFKEALRFWCKLGWISFGGTAAHIAIMHDELVEKKRWISNGSFLHALSHCMILPGPEAQQLATYIGWKLHGKRGGIVAGTLFVLPSMFVLLALSIAYVQFGTLPWAAAMFSGHCAGARCAGENRPNCVARTAAKRGGSGYVRSDVFL
jgi:hypothetical protein